MKDKTKDEIEAIAKLDKIQIERIKFIMSKEPPTIFASGYEELKVKLKSTSHLGACTLSVYDSFEFKEKLKALKFRWNPESKCWFKDFRKVRDIYYLRDFPSTCRLYLRFKA